MPDTSMTKPFGSVLTAMVTPFHADGSLDIDTAVALATRLVDEGNDGLVLNGTTGEAPTTHAPEKAELIRAVADAVGERAHIIAGAGSNDTKHAVRMAEQAAESGASGLLVVSPYYSRPSQRGIIAHTQAVADSTDLPVMLYDIPGRTGVRFAPETYISLAEHPNIVAVKDATGDLGTAAANIAATNLAWYSGDDGLYLPFLSLGAAGIVSVVSHLATPEFVTLTKQFETGRHHEAAATSQRLAPLISAVMDTGFGVVTVKAALRLVGAIPHDTLRLPQVNATESDIATLTDALTAYGLLGAVASPTNQP